MNGTLACREFVEQVTAYLDGVLSPAARTEFEQHMEECPHCRRYLAQIRMTITLSARLEPAALPSGSRGTLLACFREWTSSGSD